jgi:hypothetical protein
MPRTAITEERSVTRSLGMLLHLAPDIAPRRRLPSPLRQQVEWGRQQSHNQSGLQAQLKVAGRGHTKTPRRMAGAFVR